MSNTSLLSLFFFLCLCISPSLSDLCNPNDKKVLLKFKKSLNNPYVLASWNPKTGCCDWYCVTCDLTTNRINSLTVFAGDLPGQIPPEVGDLPYLETLMFHKLPSLTGPIQPAIAKLKNLKTLRISWTNISGPVPDFISQLTNLTFLELSFNNLSGTIPGSLSKLQKLGALHLDRNKLTGSIPESFGTFTGSIPDLYLSHNQLSGKIPASLGSMDFNTIDLSRNKLEGDASFLFGLNKTTQRIDVSRNLLEFNLSKVEFPQSLTNLDLNHNKIFGSIPAQITSLENLGFLNVSYNRLCGPIPVGGKLQSFGYTEYFHNRCLCGAPLESCK
uniref:Polygalacturonase-inhibitor protein n=1 Tax=Citrus hybrid cultivar TaxID=171250 RepID=Q8W3U7_9ROSI|nr:polygalacturonase-inhibitor protein [Citrus hybrid cultivar]